MKRKTVFWLTAIVFVLLAVYGVWHYSPLRYLTQSKAQPGQNDSGTDHRVKRPVIVAKKILPDDAKTGQTTEIPRPLVVLKDLPSPETTRPDSLPEKGADQADATKQTLVLQPDGTSIAPKSLAHERKPDASAKRKGEKLPAKSLKPEPSHPYSILLSSCRLEQSARKIVSDYQKAGLTPYVVKVKFDNGEEWLRVLAGQYQTHQEALTVKKKQQLSAAIVKKTPYTNLIGTFATQEAMQNDISRLRKLGYSPYFLKTGNDRFKLVVGAFVTREGAETLSRELQSKGIQNSVINR
jgi:cell division septation protein DedD